MPVEWTTASNGLVAVEPAFGGERAVERLGDVLDRHPVVERHIGAGVHRAVVDAELLAQHFAP
jgi:hypothetical protein